MNILDVADYCQNRKKQELNKENSKYIDTSFVSMNKNNEIKISKTPHILKDAVQCILIHEWQKKEISNWYSWYNIEFINSDGCVHNNQLDGNFKLFINFKSNLSNHIMYLKKDDVIIYSCKYPCEDQIRIIWNLYLKCKECGSTREAELLGKLAEKDETIVDLNKRLADLNFATSIMQDEVIIYKEILEKVKSLTEK